jgi:hypothetical protein
MIATLMASKSSADDMASLRASFTRNGAAVGVRASCGPVIDGSFLAKLELPWRREREAATRLGNSTPKVA